MISVPVWLLTVTLLAQVPAQQPATQQPSTQQPAPQALPETPGKRGIPPRDPRLPAPKTVPTSVPPAVPVPTVPSAAVPNRPLTADEAARIALRLQPNIVIARAGIASQRGATRQLRSALLPQMTVFGSYGYTSTLHLQPTGSASPSIGSSSGSSSSGSTGTGTGSTGTGTGTGTGSTGTGTTGTGTGGSTGTGTGGSTGTGSTGTGSTGTGSTGTGSTGTGTGSTGTGSTGTGSTGTGSTGTGSMGTGSTGSTGTGSTGTGSTSTGGGTVSNPGSGTGSQSGSGSSASTGSVGSGVVNPGTSISSVPSAISSATEIIANGFTAEVGVRQLIYDFNHTRDMVRQSVELERAAAQNLTRVQSDTVYQVKLAFYQYVQNARLVQVDEENVANRQTQLNQALARYNVGQGLQSDVVNAETAKAEAIQILNSAHANETLARANLAMMIGIDPRTPIVPAATGEPMPVSNDMNLLVQQALLHRPEILQAQSTLKSAQYGVSAAKTNNAPVISGSANALSTGNQFVPQNDYLTAGVAITFTPFDGGLTAGRVDQARANVTIAQAQLASSQIIVKNDVMQAYVDLNTAEQNVVAATADVVNAQQGVSIAEGRYSTGLGQFLDILNAQAFLLTAQTSLTQARATVDQARAEVNHAIGTAISP
jgi:outer membrane protein TolC